MQFFTNLLKAHVLDVHLPNILIGISASVEVPLVTTIGRRIGATAPQIANFVMLSSLFRTMLDIPYGIIVEYLGVRNVMLGCLVLNVVASVLGYITRDFVTLGAFCILSGISLGGFFLSRHIFVAGISAKKYRGMLMAFLSGLLRWAHVIGPVASGFIADKSGDVQDAFFIPMVCGTIAVVALTVASWSVRYQNQCSRNCSCTTSCAPSDEEAPDHGGAVAETGEDDGERKNRLVHPLLTKGEEHHFHISDLWHCFADNWGTIWRLGVFVILSTSLRTNRKLMLALFSLQHNLTDSEISYIMSLSFAFDALLFPLGGIIMDKMGRRFAVMPVCLGFGLVFFFLPFCDTNTKLGVAASAFGIADALGCGLLMTLIADCAPAVHGPPFFGIMRTIQDTGHVVGIGISSLLIKHFHLSMACWFLAGQAVLAVIIGIVFLPKQVNLEEDGTHREHHRCSRHSRDVEGETAHLLKDKSADATVSVEASAVKPKAKSVKFTAEYGTV
ncbi:integral membrane transport protein [Angomonas deanei]|uniref:Major Facilitator Superfamily, putative n=1 Tax=Angomonas deanei TaxID=59799 RepID=S9VQP6_9TRYP|nr:integral membrane transport protein [Angomonas deanei]EPY41405.1 integral membrane transport protein [Angomonas deanei]CAD2220525.1 Major Facilitator Superfamily, putative [Angomonas deanei]|eukprot:EPY29441.1 integral membrane transport protein [Angomonas deanei]